MKKIVFDFGNVIIKYRPKEYCARYATRQEDQELLYNKVFGSLAWIRLDRGVIDEETAKEEMCAALPQYLHEAARGLVDQWHSFLTFDDGICQLVYRLKAAGYQVYLLSNTSAKFHSLVPKHEVLGQFDGIFISADVHLLKPDLDIFYRFFEQFSLKPSECYFIDDSSANVEAAGECGMHAFCYDGDCTKLIWWLEKKGIL